MGIEVFNYDCEGQINIFGYLNRDIPTYKINKPVRLIELFGGVGSQAMALRDLGVDFTAWKLVEYDKYPVASYNSIFQTDFKPMDIRDVNAEDLEIVDRDKYEYILTYSFPCQDISVAGLGKSLEKGSGTRSGLLWEVERILNECGTELPQVLLMENVKNLLSSKHKDHFDKWCEFLESKGYKNFYKVMDASKFGVAQHRERVFMVSILGDYKYEFPEEIPLTKTLKDYLEDEVDEKYYITTEKAQMLVDKLIQDGKILGGYNEKHGVDLSFRRAKLQDEYAMCIRNRYDGGINEHVNEQELLKYSAYLNMNIVDKIDEPVGKALCGRDWKGFSTGFQTQNGVIECKKINKQ